MTLSLCKSECIQTFSSECPQGWGLCSRVSSSWRNDSLYVVFLFLVTNRALCVYIIVHSKMPSSQAILWIELGGNPKWLLLNFGYHDVTRAAPTTPSNNAWIPFNTKFANGGISKRNRCLIVARHVELAQHKDKTRFHRITQSLRLCG